MNIRKIAEALRMIADAIDEDASQGGEAGPTVVAVRAPREQYRPRGPVNDVDQQRADRALRDRGFRVGSGR